MFGTKLKLFIVGLSILLLFAACEFENDNHGYQRQITFPSAGGEQIIQGDNFFWNLNIEYKGDVVCASSVSPNDSIIANYEWLTVKTKFTSKELIIIADPSEDSKGRSLNIIGWFGNEYATIKVIQKTKSAHLQLQ